MKKAINFFKEKRTWSVMKDKILGWYLVPYITKVRKLGKLIVIVDGFAGCGKYGDGSEGSPIIISEIIENRSKSLNANIIGIFIENDAECFNELQKNLTSYAEKELAVLLKGEFQEHLAKILRIVDDSTAFFYIDPFGIKGLEFDHLKQILERVNISSTEILINFNYKALLREAKAFPSLAKKVMGGDYYEQVLSDSNLTSVQKEEKIIELYKDCFRKYFQFVGSCPVMYKDAKRAKYHLIFATTHFDGIKLMNNRMATVYREFYSEGRLFAAMPQEKFNDMSVLESEILNIFRASNTTNRRIIEEELIPKLFLKYTESDYITVINNLLQNKVIFSDTGKTRINDLVNLSMRPFVSE